MISKIMLIPLDGYPKKTKECCGLLKPYKRAVHVKREKGKSELTAYY